MVGEIRNGERPRCRAALVGRLVLSTLHTGTPEAALTRLIDLGVEDYIVTTCCAVCSGGRWSRLPAPRAEAVAAWRVSTPGWQGVS